jgi:hypothetical protein
VIGGSKKGAVEARAYLARGSLFIIEILLKACFIAFALGSVRAACGWTTKDNRYHHPSKEISQRTYNS